MYADANDIARQVMIEFYTPKPQLFVDQWCDRYRTMPTEGASSSASGRWDCSLTPYLIGLMRAHTDPEPREIALLKSTQVGATDGWLFSCVLYDADRGESQLLVYPTAAKGQDTNRRRLIPAFRSTAPLANQITDSRALTASELRMANGNLLWFGYTGSRDSLRGDPCGKIKADEIDAFDNSSEDALENCRSRARTYNDSLIEKASTPMGDEIGITREYDTADVQHQYHTPCPSCGQFFEMWEFGLLGWIGGVDTDPTIAAANCWISCPHCESKIREENKQWMAQHGIHITQHELIESDGSITRTLDPVTRRRVESDPMLCRLTADFFRSAESQPDPALRNQGMDEHDADELRERLGVVITGPRSHGRSWAYRVNTLCSMLAKGGWSKLVYDFVKYKGRPEATWWRDNLGQSPTKTAKSIEATNLMQLCAARHDGGHEHGQCPSWMTSCFGAVDIQKTCIKIGVWAFSPGAQRVALVLSKIVPRHEDLKLTEPAIDRAIIELTRDVGLPVQTDAPNETTFEDRMAKPAMAIDTGHWTNDAYALVDRLKSLGCNVHPVKGIENKPHDTRPFKLSDIRNHKLASGERLEGHEPTNLIMVNTDYWKDELASRLAPLDDELAQSMIDEHGQPIEQRFRAAELPGYDLWLDDDGLSMAASVIGELSAEHKILIGLGSGRTGKDARGVLREVWRKRSSHLKNDFTDIAVYSFTLAAFYGQYEQTSAKAMSQIQQQQLGIQQVGLAVKSNTPIGSIVPQPSDQRSNNSSIESSFRGVSRFGRRN